MRGRLRRSAAGASLVALATAAILPSAGAGMAAAAGSHGGTALSTKNLLKHASTDGSVLRGQTAAGEPGGRTPVGLPTHGTVTVMLQLDTTTAAQAYATAKVHGTAAATRAAESQRAAVISLAEQVKGHLDASATKATPLFSLHNVYAGVAVRTDASRLSALAAIPGVKAVRAMPAKYLENASSVPLIGAPQSWSSNGTGDGVKIGIIDTGIDYTHAMFGGTGNSRAYDADHAVADSTKLNVPSGDYPSRKVAGGYDFVGDGYDASSTDPAVATPKPDPNPLDCNSHGSHVSGTAAGYGVTPAGATYTGSYTDLGTLSPSAYQSMFRIGPGVAPGATLYALKVFGCTGSTNTVSEALDWAADPNGDGNFADHLDVVNMSLGSDYGVPDDPDSIASDNASLLGITVVAAAGNGGDLFDVGGSPGNATRVIGVAASQDALTVYDAMKVNAPAAVAGTYAGQESVAYDWARHGPTTGDVGAVDPTFDPSAPNAYNPDQMAQTNADGCDPFSPEQAARVKGKIAWEEWTDSAQRRCGSVQRSGNAKAAGAIGVVFSNDENVFAAGITGDTDIPVFQILKSGSDTLRPAAEAGTLNVTLTHDLHNSVSSNDPSLDDVIASFSSRGNGYNNLVKPDVTAPGVTIFSTAMGTGNEGMTDSGTSMATPHIAGVAALVKAAHPTWYPEQVKAAIMNTAGHDVYASSTTKDVSTREAPRRVGAGRVDTPAAVGDGVLAYGFDNPGAVGVSFGPMSVTGDTTATRLVKVENDSDNDQTYTPSFDWANAGTHPGGVDYSINGGQTVTVPAHRTATVSVVITITAAALTRTADNTLTDSLAGLKGQFVTDASGWMLLTPSSGQVLKLPVYAAPRPASAMHSASPTMSFTGSGNYTTSTVTLTGQGVKQDDYQSVVSGYELGLTSPQLLTCTATRTTGCISLNEDHAADLRYVGVTSDGPQLAKADPALGITPDDGLTYFAIGTWGAWSTPASYAEFDVLVDGNNDGQPDAVLYNTRLTGSDVFVSELVDMTGNVLDVELINNADGTIGTHPYNNNVLVMPVSTGALTALTGSTTSHRISYSVQSGTAESGVLDHTGKASVDVWRPGMAVTGGSAPIDGLDGAVVDSKGDVIATSPQFYADNDGTTLTVQRDAAAYRYDRPLGLLLLHHYNSLSSTQEVLTVAQKATTTSVVTAAPNPARIGQLVTITDHVHVQPATRLSGTVTFYDGTRMIGQATITPYGTAGIRYPFHSGDHTLRAVYGGTSEVTGSTDSFILHVLR